ncbi:glycosyltransferase [Bacillus salacetis]|uniref:Glycosyltransferase n=1 Tax=Bacillus salacetis TaxID=2315464 RepID=A0A3A1QS67_9BACI|nr:glycosyltransferase [Bacillus salacetis]RIW29394.1 glycosyltransferase [Bacillus salacetis]
MASKTKPLLSVYLFPDKNIHSEELISLIERLEKDHISIEILDQNSSVPELFTKNPRVYVSIGSNWREFPSLVSMPLHEKKRWLHFSGPDKVQSRQLFYCWLSCTEQLIENKKLSPSRFSSDTPLISIFTAAYRSKDKIQRPFQSLLKQTYQNWEWVIVDDSDDGGETYKEYLIKLDDPRVRRYRQDEYNGYIGAVKRYAASLCTGEILVEVDHDDELTADCLQKIADAFKNNPDCGFVFGDCSEVYEENQQGHWYGWDCGFGYSVYYRVWLHEMGRWQNVYRNTAINGNTLRHLVGLPNHPRAWTRECYHLAGGHREELLVADDYDLLIRTFLITKYAAIPDLLYIQYRNSNGNNSTFIRNKQIQILVKELKDYYSQRVSSRLSELDMTGALPYQRVWEASRDDPFRKTTHITARNPGRKSLIFAIPYEEAKTDALYKALEDSLENNFKDCEIIVVGDVPKDIEHFAAKAPAGAVRWWQMEEGRPLDYFIRYGEYCTSGIRQEVIICQ